MRSSPRDTPSVPHRRYHIRAHDIIPPHHRPDRSFQPGNGVHALDRHHRGQGRVRDPVGMPGVGARGVLVPHAIPRPESVRPVLPRGPVPVRTQHGRRGLELRRRSRAGRLPSERRRVPRLGIEAEVHRREVHGRRRQYGEGNDEDIAPAGVGILGHGQALPVLLRIDRGLLVVPPGESREERRPRHVLRIIPDAPAGGSREEGHGQVPLKVRQVLRRVLRPCPVQDCSGHFLSFVSTLIEKRFTLFEGS